MGRNLANSRRGRKAGLPRSAKGFTLLETMLAVGVASAAMIATLSFGNKVWAGAKLGQADQVADQVNEQVLTRFSITPSFASLPTTPASTWISDLPMSGGNVQGPWGAVQLQAATVNSAADSWALTFNAVPIDACVQMISSMSAKYYATAANGVFATAAPGQAVDPTQAASLCNSSSNKVTFVSKPLGSTSSALVVPAFASVAGSSLPAWKPPPGVSYAYTGSTSTGSSRSGAAPTSDTTSGAGSSSTTSGGAVIDTKGASSGSAGGAPTTAPTDTGSTAAPTTSTAPTTSSSAPTDGSIIGGGAVVADPGAGGGKGSVVTTDPGTGSSSTTSSAPAPTTSTGVPPVHAVAPPSTGLPITGSPVVDTTGGVASTMPPVVILNSY